MRRVDPLGESAILGDYEILVRRCVRHRGESTEVYNHWDGTREKVKYALKNSNPPQLLHT